MKVNLKLVAGVGTALLIAGNASAAVLNSTAANYSKEGMATTGGDITLPTANVTFAADYSADDRIAFTIAGATVAAGTNLTADMNCGTNVTVNFLNRDGNTINFRVNQVAVTNNIGTTCTLSGIQVTRASLNAAAAGTKVTGTYQAKTSLGEIFDTGCYGTVPPATTPSLFACDSTTPATVPNFVTLATVKSQFTHKVLTTTSTPAGTGPFDGEIDVENDRLVFTGTPNNVDTLNVYLASEGLLIESADGVTSKFVVKGDFSFAGGADGDCSTPDTGAGSVGLSGTYASTLGTPVPAAAFAKDCASITVTGPAFVDNANGTANMVLSITLPPTTANKKLSPQSFSGESTFLWPTDKKSVATWSAGAWTINGALVYVPYMPYGDGISQIIYIANRGGQNAEITVDAFDEAGDSYTFSLGVVNAGSVRKLTQEIMDGLKTGGFSGTGRVAFEMTVNAPDKDIDVYSAYNVGGADRGTVVNSQNGKALQ